MSKDYTTEPLVKENVVSFIDISGRCLFGEKIPDLETDETIAIKNPVVVHVVPQANNSMALQLLPAFFREFLGEKDNSIIFDYPKASVAMSHAAVFDFKLYGQYEAMFKAQPAAQQAPVPQEAPVERKAIKLFDE